MFAHAAESLDPLALEVTSKLRPLYSVILRKAEQQLKELQADIEHNEARKAV